MAAVVPTLTQRTVLPDVSATPFADASAFSSDAFGAGNARALIRLGDTITRAGDELTDALFKLQEQDDTREFRKLDTELTAYIRTIRHGNGTPENPGYLATNGEHAINGYSVAEQAINEKVKTLKAGASNGRVTEMFTIAANERVGSTMNDFLTHVSSEREKANVAAAEARIGAARADAATDPRLLDRSLGITASDIQDIGAEQGWGKEVIDQKVREEQSKTIEATISALVPTNTGLASKMLGQYGGMIDGLTKADITQRIDARNRQYIADRDRADALAARALAAEQTRNWEGRLVQAARGQISEDVLVKDLAAGSIDGSHFQNALSFMRTEGKEGGDPEATLALRIRIKLGQAGLGEVTSALGLSVPERTSLVEEWDQVQKSGGQLDNYAVKEAEKTVTRLVVGELGPMGSYTNTQNESLNAAITKLHEGIAAGRDLNELTNEVVEQFRSQAASIASIPKPKFWAGVRGGDKKFLAEQEQKARAATAEAFRNDQIGQQEAIKQFKILDENKQFIERLGN